MTEREALLRAVAANPDDDTPRLVYADLMDELGGEANAARARFIRLQIELARDQKAGWFARSDRLSEVCGLAGRFADRWLDELPAWAAAEACGQPLGADDFPRGFLESLRVPPVMFLKAGDKLFDVAPVRKLEVKLPSHRRGVGGVFDCPFFTRIRTLTVRCESADFIASWAAAGGALTSVEELDLSDGGLTDAGARHLAGALDLRSLRLLRAENSRLSSFGVAALLHSRKLPNLTDINVRGNWEPYNWWQSVRVSFPGKRIWF